MNRSSPPLLLALLVVLVLLGLVAVRSWNSGEPGPETLVLSPPVGEPPPSGSPNLLFIVWDTVRADRLSLYGHDRPTTPWLETFAEEAVVYDQAVSASFWTLPAHSSLFTGLPASAHRAINRRDPWLDGQFTTLAEHLGAGGWDTYAWSTNPYVYVTTNVLQGFATVDDPMREGPWRDKALADTERCLHPGDRSSKASPEHPERGRLTPKNAGETIHVALVDWLEQRRDPERPFFAFLNYMEAHTPRLPCAEARETMLGHDPELAELALSTVADTHRLHRQTLRQGRPLSERQIEAILGVYDATLLELDRKTGALIRCAVRMGAITARADGRVLDGLTRYANHVGLAFQLADDVLDEEQDAGDDGPPSFVKLLGREETTRRAQALAVDAEEALGDLAAPVLRQLARFSVERTI